MPNIKTLVLFATVFVGVNLTFVALSYVGDGVPREFVKYQIQQGFKRHNITTDKYPLFRFGLPSIYSLIGIDQISDCMTYLHAMYEPEDRLKNALNAGYLDVRNKGHQNLCLSVKQIAFNEVAEEDLVVHHKIRLWHGAKTMLLLALPRLNIFQINMLLKQTAYLAYFVLTLLLFLRDVRVGLAFVPVAILGIFASGITVHGGITNAIPYLVALLSGIALTAAPFKTGSVRHGLLGLASGSVLAFFYELDGSPMLAFALVLFCAYFHVFAGLPLKRRWASTVRVLALFGAGFVGTLLCKQLAGFVYFDPAEVWDTFIGAMGHRMSGELHGQVVPPLTALGTQFDRYYFAVINWHQAANFLKFTGTWGWGAALLLALVLAVRERNAAPLSDCLVFMMIGAVVVARYLVMANHSQIHTIIVGRYLFVLFGFAWAAVLWFGWPLLKRRPISPTSSGFMK